MKRIRAAAYLRMSDDRQENSIERQREQVRAYATRQGYELAREYLDEGIPGDEEARRKGFMAMLKDAQRKEFDIILCDDRDRFGRFDSLTMGYYCKPLRDAGVQLVTVAQGVIDWGSFAGRVTDAVLQEAKKLESQATSRRVMTRLLMMAKAGQWVGGKVNYGYRVEGDKKTGRKLVLGPEREVRAVKLIFRLYDQGLTTLEIVNELYRRAIPNPRGGEMWSRGAVLCILRNRRYVGDFCWGRRSEGKYSRCKDGGVAHSDSRKPREHNPEADWIVLPDNHPAIIDRELWGRVSARLATRPANNGGGRGASGAVLSGFLVCSRCGCLMSSTSFNGVRYFQCSKYHRFGKGACGSNMVRESRLLDCIVRKLQECFLSPENLGKLRAEIGRQLQEQGAGNQDALDGYRRKVAALAAKEAKGEEQLALLAPDMIAGVTRVIRGWRQERLDLEGRLERLETGADVKDLETEIQAAEDQLGRLRDAIAEADPLGVRLVLIEFVSRVELHFDRIEREGKVRTPLSHGTIFIKTQENIEVPGHVQGKACRITPDSGVARTGHRAAGR
jgi:site-specific DNA recombinase